MASHVDTGLGQKPTSPSIVTIIAFAYLQVTFIDLGPHDGESPELFFERVDVGGDGLVTRTDMKRYRAAALAQRRNEV